nr:hypothetical protein CFP56_22195 [Quercus suber]
MPAMNSSPVACDRPNVRVPKLAVRNRSDNSIPLSEEVSSATSTISAASQSSGLLERRISEQPVRPPSTPQPAAKSDKSAKKSGVFGFLSLKEPSTSAWEDYARQQKLQAATTKHGASPPVGVSSVSKQKLPDHVPKVNSKWDGLPDKTKKNEPRTSTNSRRRPSDQTRRSLPDDRSLDSSGRPPRANRILNVTPQDSKQGSIKSTSTSILDGIEVVPQIHVDQTSITTYITSGSSQVVALRTQASSPPKTFVSSPEPPGPSRSPASITSPTKPEFAVELDSTEIPPLTSSDLHTSPEASPQTPPADQQIHPDVRDALDLPSAFWLSDADSTVQALPSPQTRPTAQLHTLASSPTKPRVMNFSRPSRPLIETSRPSLSSPAAQDQACSPPTQVLCLAVQPFNEPVELPCPSTCPPFPTPRPQTKGAGRTEHDVTKRGRFSTLLGRR